MSAAGRQSADDLGVEGGAAGMVPIFRSLISVPAGIERMPVPAFLALTRLGSLLWNTVFVLAGYVLGVVAFVGVRVLRPGRGRRRG